MLCRFHRALHWWVGYDILLQIEVKTFSRQNDSRWNWSRQNRSRQTGHKPQLHLCIVYTTSYFQYGLLWGKLGIWPNKKINCLSMWTSPVTISLYKRWEITEVWHIQCNIQYVRNVAISFKTSSKSPPIGAATFHQAPYKYPSFAHIWSSGA